MAIDNTARPLDLDNLSALGRDATPAPWTADTNTRGDCVVWGPDGQFVMNAQAEPHWLPAADGGKRAVAFDVDRRDVELIAVMRNNWNALLAELSRVADRLVEAEAVIVNAQDALTPDHPVFWVLDDYDGSMDSVRTLTAERDAARAELAQARTFIAKMRPVLEYVSCGRGYVDVEPYPDATARFALGAIDDAASSEPARLCDALCRDVEVERDLLGRQQQAILDLCQEAEAYGYTTVAIDRIHHIVITDPADEPRAGEPLYDEFVWSGNGAEETAELSSAPDRPLFRLDRARLGEFIAMSVSVYRHLTGAPGHCGLCGRTECTGILGGPGCMDDDAPQADKPTAWEECDWRATCATCGQPIRYPITVDGDRWVHEVAPADEHEAEAAVPASALHLGLAAEARASAALDGETQTLGPVTVGEAAVPQASPADGKAVQ